MVKVKITYKNIKGENVESIQDLSCMCPSVVANLRRKISKIGKNITIKKYE